MGFNYGLEKKNFDSQWAVTRKQYENAYGSQPTGYQNSSFPNRS